jgi:4-hydroxy-L-threonine phosphate dehydrogenase PdxA
LNISQKPAVALILGDPAGIGSELMAYLKLLASRLTASAPRSCALLAALFAGIEGRFNQA